VNGAGAPLAITLGDPAGIGPEVILGAWARLRATRKAPPAFVVGGPELLRIVAERLGIDCQIVPIADPSEALFASNVGLPVMAGLDGALTPGRPSPEGARLALASLQWGVRFALSGVAAGRVLEIIIATNPGQEGDATALYIQRELVNKGVKITRLARGLPVGGDLEYADEVTLSRALEGRQQM